MLASSAIRRQREEVLFAQGPFRGRELLGTWPPYDCSVDREERRNDARSVAIAACIHDGRSAQNVLGFADETPMARSTMRGTDRQPALARVLAAATCAILAVATSAALGVPGLLEPPGTAVRTLDRPASPSTAASSSTTKPPKPAGPLALRSDDSSTLKEPPRAKSIPTPRPAARRGAPVRGVPAAITTTSTSIATPSTVPAPTTLARTTTTTTAPRRTAPRVAFTNGSGELVIHDFGTDGKQPVASRASFYPSWSPDGRFLAYGTNAGIEVFDTASSARRVISPPGLGDEWPSWSPDGVTIAFVVDGGLWVMKADGSNRRRLADLGPANYLAAWSPDGRRIAFHAATPVGSSPGYQIFVIGTDGTGLTKLTADRVFGENPMWSPDGAWIAFTGGLPEPGGLYLVRPDGTELQRVADARSSPYYVTWSPSGREVGFVGDDGVLRIIDVRSRAVGVLGVRAVGGLTWAPDGSFVVYAGEGGGGTSSLYRLDRAGGSPVVVAKSTLGGRPTFAP